MAFRGASRNSIATIQNSDSDLLVTSCQRPGPLMKPPYARLTCRAHNRFSPSTALWQHFVGLGRPFLSQQQRPSSSVAEAVQQGASNDTSDSNAESQAADDVIQPTAGGAPAIRRTYGAGLKIRKTSTAKGEWRTSKAEASVAKNIRQQYAARQAIPNPAARPLAIAREAFEAGEDYKGVVIEPMVHPTPVKDIDLPWTLPLAERNIPGIDRLAIEIDRFCAYSQPGHYETIARRRVIEQIREHTRQVLPNYVLETFGSERTGLALATSDIDLRLMKEEKFEDDVLAKLHTTPFHREREKALKHIQKLHWDFVSARRGEYLLPNLLYARYPLISLMDRRSGLDVQIVLSNDTSLSRELMKRYMEQYPYLRQLYFVVKTMFDVRGLTDVFRGGFGSYPLFMMVVASIRHSPHPRNDVAGGLINFMKFYRSFDTTKQGLSIEPPQIFNKGEEIVQPKRTQAKLKAGTAKPLPEYMLCLRDPADPTNDLGRKAVAIRHVQTTLRNLCYTLDRDMRQNTRVSLLSPLVGSSYMLYKSRRHKLAEYGDSLLEETKKSLAVKARMVREGAEGVGQSDALEDAGLEKMQ